MAKEKKFIFLNSQIYESVEVQEGNSTFMKEFTKGNGMRSHLQSSGYLLKNLKEKYGKVPSFIQYHFMFTVKSRIMSNLNNRNKHVISQGQEKLCLERMGQAFQYIEDDIMFDCQKIKESHLTDSMKWLCGILKYGDFKFEKDICREMFIMVQKIQYSIRLQI